MIIGQSLLLMMGDIDFSSLGTILSHFTSILSDALVVYLGSYYHTTCCKSYFTDQIKVNNFAECTSYSDRFACELYYYLHDQQNKDVFIYFIALILFLTSVFSSWHAFPRGRTSTVPLSPLYLFSLNIYIYYHCNGTINYLLLMYLLRVCRMDILGDFNI